MRFMATPIGGVFMVEPERFADERGFFARTWESGEFTTAGLNGALAHASISFNLRAGTLRGMHYQRAPFEEAKLVRCTQGAMFDVALDLRPASPTYRRWHAVELTADSRRMLYIPEGCAHGFQTLTDNTEVLYLITAPYSPAHGAGVRWNDPAFGIEWPPATQRIMAPRDAAYPDFSS